MQRSGGRSAILLDIILSVTILLYLPALVSAPPEMYNASNFQAQLAFAASPSQLQNVIDLSEHLQIVSFLLALIGILSPYSTLRDSRPVHALAASGFAAMSIPFFIMAHFQRFTWIQLCDAYTSAGPSDRPALASLLQLAEGQSVITGGVFWMFMASAVLIYSVAMSRSVFPHLTIRFGIASAVLALVGTVGLALNPQLAFLSTRQLPPLRLVCRRGRHTLPHRLQANVRGETAV